MSDFEGLVRPFISVVTTPARVSRSSEQGTTENTVIEVSAKGTVKIYHFSYSASVTLFMTKQEREVSKKEDPFAPSDAFKRADDYKQNDSPFRRTTDFKP